MALLNLSVFQRKLQSQKCYTCTILILNAKPNAILETIGCVLCSTHCLRFLARSKFWLYCCYHFCLKTIKNICEHECNHGTYQQIKCAYQFAKSYSSFYYMSMQISLCCWLHSVIFSYKSGIWFQCIDVLQFCICDCTYTCMYMCIIYCIHVYIIHDYRTIVPVHSPHFLAVYRNYSKILQIYRKFFKKMYLYH